MVSMLQAYQAERLQELHVIVSKENDAVLLDKVYGTADFILSSSSIAAVALGRGMAETVVAQRHLWLTLTELPETQCSDFLHQMPECPPVCWSPWMDQSRAEETVQKQICERRCGQKFRSSG